LDIDCNNPEALKHALKGVNVIISTLSGEARCQGQLNLINVAKELGTIQRFIPSEFGVDFPEDISTYGEIIKHNMEVRRALVKSGIPYTIVLNGVFMDRIFSPLMGIDMEKRTVTTIGEGNYQLSSILSDDLAKFIPRLLMDQDSLNKKVHFVGDTMSWNDIVNLLDQTFKTNFQREKMRVEDLDSKIRNERGPDQFRCVLQRLVYEGYGHFKNPWNTPNNPNYSGITPTTFRDYVRTLVK